MTLPEPPFIPQTDEAYHQWRHAHPGGFVLNVRRSLRPDYMVLHAADCGHIRTHSSPGAFTERSYRKVCATDPELLRDWAREHGRSDGTFSKECPDCRPL